MRPNNKYRLRAGAALRARVSLSLLSASAIDSSVTGQRRSVFRVWNHPIAVLPR